MGAVTESWSGGLTGVAACGVSLAAGPAARLMAPSYRQSAGVRPPWSLSRCPDRHVAASRRSSSGRP